MQQKHAESRPNMTWLDMDIRHLEFNDDEFDVVLDKGTMDAMLTSKGDVWVCVFCFSLSRISLWPLLVFGKEKSIQLGTEAFSLSILVLPHVQNPPEEDVSNCNQEIQEACRYVKRDCPRWVTRMTSCGQNLVC